MNSIDQLWDDILSREPARIKNTYKQLKKTEQKAMVDHLLVMTTENGWHVDQKHSAQIALDIINSLEKGKS